MNKRPKKKFDNSICDYYFYQECFGYRQIGVGFDKHNPNYKDIDLLLWKYKRISPDTERIDVDMIDNKIALLQEIKKLVSEHKGRKTKEKNKKNAMKEAEKKGKN